MYTETHDIVLNQAVKCVSLCGQWSPMPGHTKFILTLTGTISPPTPARRYNIFQSNFLNAVIAARAALLVQKSVLLSDG